MRIQLFLLSVFISILSYGQEKTEISSESTIVHATIDRAGDLYVIKENGNIEKYNGYGGLLNTFHHTLPPTLFDTGNGVRLLAYYRKSQEYLTLNPSLILVSQDTIDPSFAITPWLVCTSGDYNLWVLDAADWSLKKIDTRHNIVLTEALIDTVSLLQEKPAFTYMREYQQFLFLLEKHTGIHVFNGLGKHLRTIPAKHIESFNFLGEELYFVQESNIIFIDLFTLDTRKADLSGPAPSNVIVTDERIFKIFTGRIVIQPYP